MSTGATAPRPPRALLLGATVVAGQGLLLVSYAVLHLVNTVTERPSVGLPVFVFFTLLGGFLLVAGWALLHLHAWGRGPAAMAQLIQLGLAWSIIEGRPVTLAVALLLAVVAAAGLVGVLHPTSVAALAGRDPRPGTDPVPGDERSDSEARPREH